MTSVASEPWFQNPALQRILEMLNGDGGETRVVGGAVRNALMGVAVGDIDIATTLTPSAVVKRANAEGIKVVPTGIEHGTVTLVVAGEGFEVTTLRRDVETDGRRAKVAFGTDWKMDAERRDLTINALYADRTGMVIDLVEGLPDIRSRTVRFIGDATKRIAEDYLRVLRFFRFFAYYGSGRPDADGLRAVTRAKHKLKTLSAERIWSELKKLLSAPDPSRALLWMRQTGVLSEILPESEKWGIDAIHGLMETEQALNWDPDPLLRLAAIIVDDGARIDMLSKRLRMSNAQAARLKAWAAAPLPPDGVSDVGFDRMLYQHGVVGMAMRTKLALAAARAKVAQDRSMMSKAARLTTLLMRCEDYERPLFPLTGKDVLAAGVPAGQRVGEILASLETFWIERNFTPDRALLVARLKALAGEGP